MSCHRLQQMVLYRQNVWVCRQFYEMRDSWLQYFCELFGFYGGEKSKSDKMRANKNANTNNVFDSMNMQFKCSKTFLSIFNWMWTSRCKICKPFKIQWHNNNKNTRQIQIVEKKPLELLFLSRRRNPSPPPHTHTYIHSSTTRCPLFVEFLFVWFWTEIDHTQTILWKERERKKTKKKELRSRNHSNHYSVLVFI